MRKLAIVAAIGLIGGSAHAGTTSETIDFSLSGFVDIVGSSTPPIPLITGSFTINYDPTQTYDSDTTDIVVHSLTGVTVGSALGFTYQNGFLEFGGIQNDSDIVYSNTNDLVVSFNITDPSHPQFVPCSTSGYTCGKYTGSSLVEAAGYTQIGSNTAWFYGAPQSTASAVPEPPPVSLLAFGLAAIGLARRVRPIG
jgi:hypothetical protein